jgi:hypothetical protein
MVKILSSKQNLQMPAITLVNYTFGGRSNYLGDAMSEWLIPAPPRGEMIQ